MLDCPNCEGILTPINVGTTGGSLTIDHCPNCSGSWFDPYEINRISLKDVLRLSENLLIKKREMPPPKIERLCPRDFHPLARQSPDIIPEHISMERCLSCHGIFIMQKELEKLKSSQTTRVNIFKNLSIPFSLNAIFIPFIFISLLMFSTFMTITSLDDAQNSAVRAKEEIQLTKAVPITDSTVSIFFLTTSKTTSEITYGTGLFDQKTETVSTIPTKTHQIILTSLAPGTTYKYKIILILPDGHKLTSKEYTFNTE